jgi:hypothetical protein
MLTYRVLKDNILCLTLNQLSACICFVTSFSLFLKLYECIRSQSVIQNQVNLCLLYNFLFPFLIYGESRIPMGK